MARVLITGAESGLGLALLRAYTDAGDSVSLLCRRTSSELTTLAPDIHADVDVESNISGDMFTVMRMALQPQRMMDNQKVAKATRAPAQALSIKPREALQWATIDSARALGLDKKVGSLKPGKQADIVMLNGKDLNLFPVNNPIESVVFHAHGGNVDTVMIAGKIAKQNGKLKYRGLEKKMDQLARSGRKILKGVKLAA